jgi:dihydrofolate reductase
LSRDAKAFATHLRAGKGKDIWMMGGAGVIASFPDEFVLSVIPVRIGEGIPLLAPRHRTVPLTLIANTKYADGVVKLHYSINK